MGEGGREEFKQPMGYRGMNVEGGGSVDLEKQSSFEEHNKSADRILNAKSENVE